LGQIAEISVLPANRLKPKETFPLGKGGMDLRRRVKTKPRVFGDLLRLNPASFNFDRDITVATWIKQELTGGDHLQSTLIVAMDSEGARKFAVLLDRGNKRFCVQTTNIDSGTDFDTYTVVGSWFHFPLTKSGTKARIYVNGSPIGGDFVVENATGNDIGIGRYTAVNSRGCNCSFDEFRVYGRALFSPGS
jgi:Concanavalin A-like lectin/glucanases superfamily